MMPIGSIIFFIGIVIPNGWAEVKCPERMVQAILVEDVGYLIKPICIIKYKE